MIRPLLPLLPVLLAAAAPELPPTVSRQCTPTENASSLVHLRCGEARLLVAQLRHVDSPVHDEILESMLDLVPGPHVRDDPDAAPDLIRTRIAQHRGDLERGERSVVLVLTSRRSTGRSAACVFAVDGHRRVDRHEHAWCDEVTAALLPPPPPVPPATHVEVDAPDHGLDDLAGP